MQELLTLKIIMKLILKPLLVRNVWLSNDQRYILLYSLLKLSYLLYDTHVLIQEISKYNYSNLTRSIIIIFLNEINFWRTLFSSFTEMNNSCLRREIMTKYLAMIVLPIK